MSVQTQIDRIAANIKAAFTSVGNKGGTVPAQQVSANLPSAIDSIPVGVELPELTNPGGAGDLMAGKQLIDASGEPVNGTFTLETEMSAQDALIAKIKQALKGKAAGGGSTEPDPSELYQRVEYITSDGEAYILTDFVADNTCGVEMVLSFPHFADHTWIGSREDSGNTRFFAPYAYSTSIWYAGFNTNVKISASTQIETIYRCQVNFMNSRLTTVHDEADTMKGSASISDTLTAHTYPICIFTQNYAGTPRTPRIISLYSARCSKGYDVVREYIPCYRTSDGVIGMYEKFTGTFLTTPVGTLAKGPDVEWKEG